MTDGPNIEMVLAQQANDAMAAGADPKATTERLHRMIAHLRANPEMAKHGTDALAQGADPGAILTRVWEMAQQAPDTPEAPKPTPHYYGGDEAKAGFVQGALDAVPFATKGMAAIDALGSAAKAATVGRSLTDVATGKEGGFLDTLRDAYNTNYDAREAALENYRKEHPISSKVATVTGALAPAVITMGGSTGAQATGMGARMLAGAKAGAVQGVLQGASNAHGDVGDYAREIAIDAPLGAVGGSLAAPLMAGATKLVTKSGLPNLVSKGAEKLRAEIGTRIGAKSGLAKGLDRLTTGIGDKGVARAELGTRIEADRLGGFVPADEAQGVPLFAIDRGGPNVEKLAEGIAHGSPGPGAAKIVQTLNQRIAQKSASVRSALERGTGLSEADARALKPAEQLVEKGRKEMRAAYKLARETTKGQAFDSPAYREVVKTPVGQAARRWAEVQKANRFESLPKVAKGIESVADDLGIEKSLGGGALDVPDMETLPDPETLHYMKQFLAKVSRLGVRDGAGGTVATEAQGALGVWGRIRGEMPDVWKAADDIAAKHFRAKDMLDRGRAIYSTRANPKGNSDKALKTSLHAFEQDVAKATQEGRESAQKGAAIAAHARMGSAAGTSSPGRTFFGGNAPEKYASERMAQTRQAFPSDAAFDEFGNTVSAWDRIQAQANRVLGNSRTAGRGMESAARDGSTPSALRELIRGNIGNAASALVTAGSKATEKAARSRVDSEIADLLMSSHPTALDDAFQTLQWRRALQSTLDRKAAQTAGRITSADY